MVFSGSVRRFFSRGEVSHFFSGQSEMDSPEKMRPVSWTKNTCFSLAGWKGAVRELVGMHCLPSGPEIGAREFGAEELNHEMWGPPPP